MKTRTSIVIIIVLVITIIIVAFKYNSLLAKQNDANVGVKVDLSIASSSFINLLPVERDNSLTAESIQSSKSYNYNQALSKVASASQLFELTSYNNNILSGILDNLCNVMEQDEYKDAIIQKSRSIYEPKTIIFEYRGQTSNPKSW